MNPNRFVMASMRSCYSEVSQLMYAVAHDDVHFEGVDNKDIVNCAICSGFFPEAIDHKSVLHFAPWVHLWLHSHESTMQYDVKSLDNSDDETITAHSLPHKTCGKYCCGIH